MADATGSNGHREMVEVVEPKMVQFSAPKQQVEGVLIAIEKVNVKGKPTIQYLCEDSDGHPFTFLSTYDIGRKLSRKHVGRYIAIQYEGEDATVKTQGSPLKRFTVLVSKQREQSTSLEITDEDIPF